MTFATQASAKDAIWVLIHSIVPNDTDVTYKKRGTFSSNNILHADFFFDNLESCRDALKDRALWKMLDEDTNSATDFKFYIVKIYGATHTDANRSPIL